MAARDWREWAATLEVGKSVRVQHTCADDRSMLVSRSDSGTSAYCFRCGKVGWLPPPVESTAEKVARIARQRAGDSSLPPTCVLPGPQEYDIDKWPEGAKIWIYKAGLSRADAGVLRLYWHHTSDRVVIPVLSATGNGQFYVARAYQKGRAPKYLCPTPKPKNLYASWGRAKAVCLTEDILSAIKIGMASGEAVCLFGTKISDYVMSRVMTRHVLVMLDPDPPGQRGALRICAQLKAYGVPYTNIVLDRDPKLLSLAALKEKLNEGRSVST
jgi:DNA primase